LEQEREQVERKEKIRKEIAAQNKHRAKSMCEKSKLDEYRAKKVESKKHVVDPEVFATLKLPLLQDLIAGTAPESIEV
jgi:hypothetical protein